MRSWNAACPAIKQRSFNKEEMVPKRKKICKWRCPWPLVLVKKMFGEVVESKGRGLRGMMACD